MEGRAQVVTNVENNAKTNQILVRLKEKISQTLMQHLIGGNHSTDDNHNAKEPKAQKQRILQHPMGIR